VGARVIDAELDDRRPIRHELLPAPRVRSRESVSTRPRTAASSISRGRCWSGAVSETQTQRRLSTSGLKSVAIRRPSPETRGCRCECKPTGVDFQTRSSGPRIRAGGKECAVSGSSPRLTARRSPQAAASQAFLQSSDAGPIGNRLFGCAGAVCAQRTASGPGSADHCRSMVRFWPSRLATWILVSAMGAAEGTALRADVVRKVVELGELDRLLPGRSGARMIRLVAHQSTHRVGGSAYYQPRIC
jgi:hypothetical protein